MTKPEKIESGKSGTYLCDGFIGPEEYDPSLLSRKRLQEYEWQELFKQLRNERQDRIYPESLPCGASFPKVEVEVDPAVESALRELNKLVEEGVLTPTPGVANKYTRLLP